MRLKLWTHANLLSLELVLLILKSHFLSAQNADIDLSDSDFDQCSAFECAKPWPERFRLTEEIVNTTNSGYVISNKDFILYRCRSSGGCCPNVAEFCTASKMKPVCIKFEYQRYDSSRIEHKFIMMPNHTECKCSGPQIKDSAALYTMMDSCYRTK